MDLTTVITMKIRAQATKDVDMDADPLSTLAHKAGPYSWADGTGASQANQVYFDAHAIAGSATKDYDLAGSLTDVFGDTITFTSIKAILIENTDADCILHVGGGDDGSGSNAFDTWITSDADDGSEKVILQPGGAILLVNPAANGYAVTAGTGDILRITEASGNAGTFEITIIGEV